MEIVREFYERHPYPPVPSLLQPRRGEGTPLRFELGAAAAGAPRGHEGIRVAVVGAGTLEPLVVARAHPRAREIVAVDVSRRSLAVLGRRVGFARATGRLLLKGRLPPIRRLQADVATLDAGRFDYVVATNVLHHHADPAALLARLAASLVDGGILRLVTYPAHSRLWLRVTGRWLRLAGLGAASRDLVAAARRAVAELPADHPVRLSHEDNPESSVAAGVADAYLHPCENPLSPSAWGRAAAHAGLELVAEGQASHSRSTFLDDLAPSLAGRPRWEKLQLLDDLLELAANPVLWLVKRPGVRAAPPAAPPEAAPREGTPPGPGIVLGGDVAPADLARRLSEEDAPLWLPSDVHVEMADGLRRFAALAGGDADVREVVAALAREVGPRVAWRDPSRVLPLLTLGERDPGTLLALPRPFGPAAWRELAARLPGRLVPEDASVAVDEDPLRSAERLQIAVGAVRPWIGPLRWRRP